MTCEETLDCKKHWYYAERIFKNNTKHICIQCGKCGKLCRSPLHNNKAFIPRHQISEKHLSKIREWKNIC